MILSLSSGLNRPLTVTYECVNTCWEPVDYVNAFFLCLIIPWEKGTTKIGI